MSRLPIVDFRTMEKVLLHLGFQRVRQTGSHVFYRHTDGRSTGVRARIRGTRGEPSHRRSYNRAAGGARYQRAQATAA